MVRSVATLSLLLIFLALGCTEVPNAPATTPPEPNDLVDASGKKTTKGMLIGKWKAMNHQDALPIDFQSSISFGSDSTSICWSYTSLDKFVPQPQIWKGTYTVIDNMITINLGAHRDGVTTHLIISLDNNKMILFSNLVKFETHYERVSE